MIETREHLIHVLTEAAEIEHNLLCSYLYAAFSLRRPGEPGLGNEQQASAVERWRKTIVKVALEEMAHLAVVNNLLTAVGGAPHFDRSNFPVAPGYHPAQVVVRLTPFDAETLRHFIFLERPETAPLDDAPGFEPVEAAARTPRRGALTPSAADYLTIGALYDSLAAGFEHLAARLGEAVLIDVEGRGQLDAETVGLPNVVRVTRLSEALSAIAWIKEEGEGSTAGRVDSHFERFRAIEREWAALSAADPGFTPAWPAAHDPVMRAPAPGAERVWVRAEPAAAHLDLGNALYGLMLQVLTQTFGCDEPDDQRRLMKASVELMEACAAVATRAARLPAADDHPGVNAGLSFAVPRNLGFRRTAGGRRALFAERVRELAEGARGVVADETAEKVARRLGNALALLAP